MYCLTQLLLYIIYCECGERRESVAHQNSMDGLGAVSSWGFSPSIDVQQLLNDVRKELNHESPASIPLIENGDQDKSEREINVFFFGVVDTRHLIKTICRFGRHSPSKLNVFVLESQVPLLARHMLFLSMLLEHPDSIQDHADLILELYGDALIREKCAHYLKGRANELIRSVTHAEGNITSILDLSQLKFKERDDLEFTFKFWKDESKVFDMKTYWENRLRKLYGERYDHRDNLIDWDYQMKLRDKAPMISKAEYSAWRDHGVAFQVRDSAYTHANRSLATVSGMKQSGITVNKWGYFGDIVVGPFLAHGVVTDNKELLKTQNGQHVKTANDIARYNISEHLVELRAAGGVDLLRDRLSVKLLPVDPSVSLERRKSQLVRKFDAVFLGTSMAHRLKDVKDLLRPDGVVVVETAQYFIQLNSEQTTTFHDKIQEIAKTNEYSQMKLTGYDCMQILRQQVNK
ncbi:hypothetical protein M427DRAFT_197113 [Gonapodya prolifera JEL478]|uniref:DUF4470 domain-containing protein n=1 Tax=Gonapodya prolifera (strain JEL478) TaxID=1344416 RepID=A0A139APM2_GONPJ|nr:hypothetical protein M427DRAFT_197113 [Gonapodya prolifera JEL478]|eukprot:KXS18668.1 hypothetical protein M427DRAFT_197113 [Gonapodya prolifera JEL478]